MRNLFWGLVLIIIGILILLDNLGYADFQEIISNFWPLLLILWGLSFLLRRRKAEHQEAASQQAEAARPAPEVAAGTGSIPPPPLMGNQEISSDLIHQSNVFGDLYTKITSQQFKGGSISTVFGGCHLDLTAAAFADGDHELRIHSVFGSSLIILPKDAAVSIAASSVVGDLTILGQPKRGFSVDIKTATASFSAKPNRLNIHINNVFGDVRVE